MQWSGFWLVLALVVIIIGVLMVVRSLRRTQVAVPELEQKTKHGLPIVAREDRELSSLPAAESEEVDALSSMAAAMSAAPVIVQTADDAKAAKVADEPLPHSEELPLQQDDDDGEPIAVEQINFEQNSPVLDKHLDERRQFDQNNDPLLHATETVSIAIMPRHSFAGLPGKTILDIAKTYGIKFGVMNLFHRYENEDGTGDLWFSMMGMGYEGVRAFDLNTLHEDHFIGLTLFLPLPHPQAVCGFDSMVSVAKMIAQELSADMLDEQGNVIDDAYFDKLRAVIVEQQYG
ncbi:cell division protein ZipA C-terminal FtsZ-binding domain-containing protein [Moraxella cuniculi]|uniref:Cell division protein ZipA n=1 Tax=Moraxella cuniculi TaxID=34061 RepID=A0A448GV73_9GAMM|nr:cell division protein ZipA C-terminal FtsZ-binding domain-containing protein [Moraxella cuniculi]VEG12686.1 Cell division protein ZipA [Moraxella cuniculi]